MRKTESKDKNKSLLTSFYNSAVDISLCYHAPCQKAQITINVTYKHLHRERSMAYTIVAPGHLPVVDAALPKAELRWFLVRIMSPSKSFGSSRSFAENEISVLPLV